MIWNNSLALSFFIGFCSNFFHLNLSSFFIISWLSLETFSRSLEGHVSIQQFLVAVLPLDAISLLKLLLVFVHEAHEVDGEVITKVEFTSDIVRNSTEVCQNCNDIRLLVVVRIIEVMVTHQVVSIFDVWTKVSEVINILRVTHKSIPWSTLNGFAWPRSAFQLFDESGFAQFETVLSLHLFVLGDNSISLTNWKCFEEVG